MNKTFHIELQVNCVCSNNEFIDGIKLYYLPIEDQNQSIQHANLITSIPGEITNSCDEQDNPVMFFKPSIKVNILHIKFYCQVNIKHKKRLLSAQSDLIDSKLFDFMPWQRVCLFEYTQPAELPEHIVYKLHRYAMFQADQSHFDPIKTIRKLNKIAYQQPAKLLDLLKGTKVLSDNRNQQKLILFVLLCRVLSIPTRYVRGYVKQFSFVGQYQFKIHLWAEVYIPYVGWIGFDPKCYRLVDHNYIRCAVFASVYQDVNQCQSSNKYENRPNSKLVEISLSG